MSTTEGEEKMMTTYIIGTQSGHNWLIESAASEAEALEQYYTGDAEPHTSIRECDDEEEAEYLREQGQAS